MCTKFSEKLIFPILTDMHMSVCVSAGKKSYDAPLGVPWDIIHIKIFPFEGLLKDL